MPFLRESSDTGVAHLRLARAEGDLLQAVPRILHETTPFFPSVYIIRQAHIPACSGFVVRITRLLAAVRFIGRDSALVLES